MDQEPRHCAAQFPLTTGNSWREPGVCLEMQCSIGEPVARHILTGEEAMVLFMHGGSLKVQSCHTYKMIITLLYAVHRGRPISNCKNCIVQGVQNLHHVKISSFFVSNGMAHSELKLSCQKSNSIHSISEAILFHVAS